MTQTTTPIYRAFRLQGGNPNSPDPTIDNMVGNALAASFDGRELTSIDTRTTSIAATMQEEGWRFCPEARMSVPKALEAGLPCLATLNAAVNVLVANELADKGAPRGSGQEQREREHTHA